MVGQAVAQGDSVGNASRYLTDTARPAPGTLLLAFVASARNQGVDPPAVPKLTGCNVEWQQEATLTTGLLGERRLTCLRALSVAPVDGPLVLDFGPQQQDYCAWVVIAYGRIDTAGSPDGTGFVTATTGTASGESLTIDPTAPTSARNALVGALMTADFNAPVREISPSPGFVEIAERHPNQGFGPSTTLQTQDSPSVPGEVTWTWTGSVAAVAMTIEIAIAADVVPPPPTDPVEALIRRFEPILHLHSAEQFVPVDAKRYIEHAALWRAVEPRYDNDNWGGGPLVARDQLSASESEPGEYLGRDDLLQSPVSGAELFLELGGWKDASGTPEPDVTDTSSNQYSNADTIAARYRDEDALRNSRFWYHAEYLDHDALVRAAGRGGAPNYAATLQHGLNVPSLLLYHLFFPHHKQTVSQGGDFCRGKVSAIEISSHAGDWQCVAVLLDDDGSGAPQPQFIGLSGVGPEWGESAARPFQVDADGYVSLQVEQWQPTEGETAGLPVTVSGHPRLYVAEGSHGLHMTSGDHTISAYVGQPYPLWCGEYDASSVAPKGLGQPEDDDSFLDDLGAWLGILLTAFSLGFAAGVVVAALAGRIPTPSGLDIVGTGDTPDDDRTDGAGITIAPTGVGIPGVGTVEAWRSQQKLVLEGRQYDMRVDRDNQIWWPGTDGESGFRGRWGQRVTSDALPRRSGPLFPDFARMFLAALEDGRTRGLFP